jgi:hypothetical protein
MSNMMTPPPPISGGGLAPLSAGNASVLAIATMGLSGNKYMLGLMILLINLGARYIGNEVSDFMHKVLNHKFARRLLIFLVIWMGTRDLIVALIITSIFIISVNTIFNEQSRFCILPIENNTTITKEEYEMAKQLIEKYEKANPPIPSSIPNSGNNNSNNSINNNNTNNNTKLPTLTK